MLAFRPATLIGLLLLGSGASAASAAAPPAGESLYVTCAACHGRDDGGVADGSVPAIGGQDALVVTRVLEAYRNGSREDLRMTHFADPDHLPDIETIRRVAEVVAALRRATPVTVGSGRALDLGGDLYRRTCASCHGVAAAAVPGRAILALAGQHAPYLERVLTAAAEGRARHLVRTHGRVLSGLTGEERAALADYLSRLPAPTPSKSITMRTSCASDCAPIFSMTRAR